ncbi:VanZ family protein [Secundilactobacillus similis]|uniref:VanZ family protein n=1 Tax=Secundilactobacillus similis TaxID=414682 RepID=UPI0009E6F5C2|nr:VanZ family protein [Secundilactobacillus similis]
MTLTPTSFAYGIIPTMEPVWVGVVPTNPIPFRGIELDFYMNIVMMVPMGVYLALFKKWSGWRILLIGVLMGTAIESTQFVLDTVLHMSRWSISTM